MWRNVDSCFQPRRFLPCAMLAAIRLPKPSFIVMGYAAWRSLTPGVIALCYVGCYLPPPPQPSLPLDRASCPHFTQCQALLSCAMYLAYSSVNSATRAFSSSRLISLRMSNWYVVSRTASGSVHTSRGSEQCKASHKHCASESAILAVIGI